ncbi:limostatin isoform X2 [Musca autumnalis]|uniref:limostatin isoform X2 n=1 Tax=Musca autumnalis TaxID=221902 RepID=UPI003CF5E749
MFAVNGKFLLFVAAVMLCLALSWAQNTDDSIPSVLSYNSPLRQPQNLQSRPYIDFLSTLYRNDKDKSNLYRNYRSKREVDIDGSELNKSGSEEPRSRRAIVFRPLFVYRQQQVRRQQLAAQRKRRV